MDNYSIKTNKFIFNENLMLLSYMFNDGTGDVYYPQDLVLTTDFNSVTLHLMASTLKPELLRKLADDLEKTIEEAKFIIRRQNLGKST